MQQSIKQKSSQKCYNTITKLLDYEFSYESKESTREQLYEEVFRYKTNLRRDNHNLKREIEQTKQAILSKALGLYFNELRELSEHNQYLREKHRLIYESKKPVIRNTAEDTAKSPLLTPRSRRSVVNIYDNENNFCQPSLKGSRPTQIDLKLRKSLQNENIENIKPRMVHGRNSLKISEAPRRVNQQLTERKMVSNSLYCTQNCSQYINNNVSTFSDTHSLKGSQKSKSRAIQVKNSDNIFMNFIQVMLEEQKMKQKQVLEILDHDEKNFHKNHGEQQYVNTLENQVEKTTHNIEKLQKVLSNYELEIKQMQINLNSVTDMTKELGKVKQNYLIMQEKCKNIESLRVEVANKERKLRQIKQSQKLEYFEPPSSIKMLLRLFGIEQNNINDPRKCKQQVINLVKGCLQKPSKKKVKVKELLDTIRDGRKKFKQLMSVYEARIKKLQKKLASLKFNQSRVAEI